MKGESGLTEIEKDVTGVVALEGAAKGIMKETDDGRGAMNTGTATGTGIGAALNGITPEVLRPLDTAAARTPRVRDVVDIPVPVAAPVLRGIGGHRSLSPALLVALSMRHMKKPLNLASKVDVNAEYTLET